MWQRGITPVLCTGVNAQCYIQKQGTQLYSHWHGQNGYQTISFRYFTTTFITIPVSVHGFKSLSWASSRWCTPQQALWPESQVSCSWSSSLPTVCQCRSIRSPAGWYFSDVFSAWIHRACRSAQSSIPKRLSCTLRATSHDKWSLRERQSVKYKCSIARWLCSYQSLTVFKWPVNSQSKARSLSPDSIHPCRAYASARRVARQTLFRVDDPNPVGEICVHPTWHHCGTWCSGCVPVGSCTQLPLQSWHRKR